jgi:hypothetical protein
MGDGPMLDAEERMEISILSRHGRGIRSIARATGRSRNRVRRYLRCGDDFAARRKPGIKRIAKLDPFKDYILERLRAAAPAAWLSGRGDACEGLHPRLAAAAPARSGGAFRDRATGYRSLWRRWAGAGRPISSSARTNVLRR